MNEYFENSRNDEKWIGSNIHYMEEKDLCDFYVQMNQDCGDDHSRVIWEWLRNAPCLEEFNIDKFKMWKENGKVVCAVRPMSPWLGDVVIDSRCTTDKTFYTIIRYIEENLSKKQDNKNYIFVMVCSQEDNFDQFLRKKGYENFVVFGMMRQRKMLIWNQW